MRQEGTPYGCALKFFQVCSFSFHSQVVGDANALLKSIPQENHIVHGQTR